MERDQILDNRIPKKIKYQIPRGRRNQKSGLKNQISDIRPPPPQKNQLSDITPPKKSNIRYQGAPVLPPPPPPPHLIFQFRAVYISA